MKTIKTKMQLKDFDTGKKLDVTITRGQGGGILITPKGYGDKCSNDGDGVPILLDFYCRSVKPRHL